MVVLTNLQFIIGAGHNMATEFKSGYAPQAKAVSGETWIGQVGVPSSSLERSRKGAYFFLYTGMYEEHASEDAQSGSLFRGSSGGLRDHSSVRNLTVTNEQCRYAGTNCLETPGTHGFKPTLLPVYFISYPGLSVKQQHF